MQSTTYNCNLDANGWQLYSFDADEIADGKPDSDAVAKTLSEELTNRVRAARKRLSEESCISELKLAKKIRDEMYEIMDKYSDAGACDTEPQCALVSELEAAFGLDAYSLDR